MRDNQILCKQMAEVKRDLEDLKAEFRSLAEDTEGKNFTAELKRVQTAVKANQKATQQSLQGVQAEVAELQDKQSSMVERVTSLTNTVTLVEATQASMKDLMDARHVEHLEMEARVVAIEKAAGVPTMATHPSTMAIHLVGLEDLQRAVGDLIPRGIDPVEIVRRLLSHIQMQFYMTRIQLLGVEVTEAGRTARSAVIHMTSAFHKNEALVRIKKVLGQISAVNVVVEDCFPASTMEEVKLLKYHGHQQKANGKVAKFRVINRGGRPVLQTGLTPLGQYKDDTPPPTLTREAMEAEQAARGYQRRPRGGPRPLIPQPDGQRNDSRRQEERRPPPPQERRPLPPPPQERQSPPPPQQERSRGGNRRDPSPHKHGDKDRRQRSPPRRDERRWRDEREDSRQERRGNGGARRPFDGYWSPPRSPVSDGFSGPHSYSQQRTSAPPRNADLHHRRY